MKTKRTSLTNGDLCQSFKQKSRTRRGQAQALAARPSTVTCRNDLLPTLTIVERSVSDLRFPSRNVRRSETAHVREVADAIAALGFCQPVLIDREGQVIDGVIRVQAARLLGLMRVPCVSVEHLKPSEIQLLRLAANRLGETGAWDLGALKIEFDELIQADAPIEITGFDAGEIDQICLDDTVAAVENGQLEPDLEANAVARAGDYFELGPHRLLCGDATDPNVLQQLLDQDGPVRLVLTDEPYNVPIAGNVTSSGHREFAMASGEMSDTEFLQFNKAWMTNAASYLCDGGVVATFCDWRAWPTVVEAARTLGLSPLNLVVWAKTNAGMGSLYRSQHELLPLFKKGIEAHVNNVDLGAKGRWRSNVWTYPGASSLGSDARRGLKDHPTVKPVAMLEDALLDLTNRGDIVLDPFLGSGSTLIAAQRTGRVCRGIEIDPLYADVVIRRFQDETGHDAVLVATGETFEALTRARSGNAAETDEDRSNSPGNRSE